MRSATSSEGSRLVGIAAPYMYAHTRVAIEMHSRTNGVKCRVLRDTCSAGHVHVLTSGHFGFPVAHTVGRVLIASIY